MSRLDLLAGHDAGILHRVFELSYIARPHRGREEIDSVFRECLARALTSIELTEKGVGEMQDISLPFAQRWLINGEGHETEQEIFAELSVLHRLLRRAIGGGDDTDVDRNFLTATHARDATRLQCAQKLHLEVERHFRDFIGGRGPARGARGTARGE